MVIDAHVIYGPPGTGKSTELIRRMKQCIEQGTPEDKVGFVSFTKAAAIELANRIGIKSKGNISTIHSMAFRLSGIIKDQVINRPKLREFSKISGIEIAGANPDEAEYLSDGDAYLALYQLYHARCGNDIGNSYRKFYWDSDRPGELIQFIRFCNGMNDFKRANGYVDFNDMLERALDQPGPDIDILFVDEAQDLSPLQWKLVYHWCGYVKEVHIAGDDDQSIYVWGGADPIGMPKFEKHFNAKRTILNQSYRIPLSIHKLAHKIITNVKNRVSKTYHAMDRPGTVNHRTDINMINIKHGDDVLILFRNHFLRDDIEERIIELGLPYMIDSGKPGLLHSYHAKAIQNWKILIQDWNQTGQIMLRKKDYNNLIWNVIPRIKYKIENDDIDSIKNMPWNQIINAPFSTIIYLKNIISEFGSLSVEPTIHLSTIHGSKGREADHVILINGMSNRSVDAMQRDPDSEYRTFYVGVTRTKHRLDIIPGENLLDIL